MYSFAAAFEAKNVWHTCQLDSESMKRAVLHVLFLTVCYLNTNFVTVPNRKYLLKFLASNDVFIFRSLDLCAPMLAFPLFWRQSEVLLDPSQNLYWTNDGPWAALQPYEEAQHFALYFWSTQHQTWWPDTCATKSNWFSVYDTNSMK